MLQNAKHSGLERSLGFFQLVVLGLGAVIGVGILVLTGTAASQAAGPAVIISFAISAIAALCTGLCYAELAATIPVSGSVYAYMYVAVGEVVAWVMGCMTVLFLTLTMSAVAVGWSGYTQSFLSHFGIMIPAEFAHTTGTVVAVGGVSSVAIMDLPAFMIVSILTVVLYGGMACAQVINTVSVIVKVAILAAFVIFGITKINPANFVPFIPENSGSFGSFGITGVIRGASMVFMAYCGFDVLALATQESKNPQKNIPAAIIVSLVLAAITYMIVSGVMVGLVNYRDLGHSAPIALAVDVLGIQWFSTIIKLGAVIGLIPVMLSLIYAVSRMVYSIAKDGLLPTILSKVHKETHTPAHAVIMVGMLSAILAATVPLGNLVNLVNACIIISYVAVCVVCIYLRYSQPKMDRTFKCPWMPFVPACALILYAQMLYALPATVYQSLAVVIALLLVVYFTYGIHHSVLQNNRTSRK